MGEPGGLPSMGSHGVGHDYSDLAAAAAVVISSLYKKVIECRLGYFSPQTPQDTGKSRKRSSSPGLAHSHVVRVW